MPGLMHSKQRFPAAGPERRTRAVDDAKGGLIRCPHCENHFFAGGAASPDPDAEEFDREHEAELGQGERTRDYDKEFGHYYGDGEAGFAHGGEVVDGAGKVDGIHRHPSECSHLAAGGVCRHLAPNPGRRAAGEDYADHHVRNFSAGGKAKSFEGYLAQRRAVRGGRFRKEG
jgi:hypothetical protein